MQKETIFENGIEKVIFKLKKDATSKHSFSFSNNGLVTKTPSGNILEIIFTHHNHIPVTKGDNISVTLTLFNLVE